MKHSSLFSIAFLAGATVLGGAKASTETVLYSFKGGASANGPGGHLLMDKTGILYGAAASGGVTNSNCNGGCGVVFKLSPPAAGGIAWTEIALYNFKGSSDGGDPNGSLIADSAGNLYGTTYFGGSSGYGTVFEISPPAKGKTAWTKEVLHTFLGGSDGAYPGSAVSLALDANGALYGTTIGGGDASCSGAPGGPGGCGTVFKLAPPAVAKTAWTEQILHRFTGKSDGANPEGGVLIGRNGALYSSTSGGNGATGNGVIFTLMPPKTGKTTWSDTVLYTFKEGTDGAGPVGNLISDSSGALYGTTQYGGVRNANCSNDCGTLFKLAPPAAGKTSWTETILYRFVGGADGAQPISGLFLGSGGKLYGTTLYTGGSYSGNGTVFQLTPPVGTTAWTRKTLHGFTGESDGAGPDGSLISGPSGSLLGTAGGGGPVTKNCPSGCGVVYKITP